MHFRFPRNRCVRTCITIPNAAAIGILLLSVAVCERLSPSGINYACRPSYTQPNWLTGVTLIILKVDVWRPNLARGEILKEFANYNGINQLFGAHAVGACTSTLLIVDKRKKRAAIRNVFAKKVKGKPLWSREGKREAAVAPLI